MAIWFLTTVIPDFMINPNNGWIVQESSRFTKDYITKNVLKPMVLDHELEFSGNLQGDLEKISDQQFISSLLLLGIHASIDFWKSD